MRCQAIITTASLLLTGAVSQFVSAPNDLTTKMGSAGVSIRYKEVPNGICETDPDIKSYAGYADVSPNEHIFWWFFEARNVDPTKAPLTAWLDGGPGGSSMAGLFNEIGPCGIGKDQQPYSNPNSWSNVSNMIFIDQPLGTGFSYSSAVPGYVGQDGYLQQLPSNVCPDYAEGSCATYSAANVSITANSTTNAAPAIWKTLQGFMGAFPQYSSNGFNMATESYGGHYGPVYNKYFQTQNANANGIPNATRIDINSVLIGNGWFDPLVQYAAAYNYTVSPGNSYDFSPFNQSYQDMMYNSMWGEGNCYDQITDCYQTGRADVCNTADNNCGANVQGLLGLVSDRNEGDIRENAPNPRPNDGDFSKYLNQPNVQEAIGAFVNFTGTSVIGDVFDVTGDDGRLEGVTDALESLLDNNVTISMYHGDADYNCNWLGGLQVARNLNRPGFNEAGFQNLSTSDDQVHGQVLQAGRFSFTRIYLAGHGAPPYQPVAALAIFNRTINNYDVATGNEPIKSDYLSNGSQNSTFNEGGSDSNSSKGKSSGAPSMRKR